mgnify:FL=1
MNKEYREYYTRRKQEKGTLDGFNVDNWEEIPDEDIWEDGKITQKQVSQKILNKFYSGQWKLIREIK